MGIFLTLGLTVAFSGLGVWVLASHLDNAKASSAALFLELYAGLLAAVGLATGDPIAGMPADVSGLTVGTPVAVVLTWFLADVRAAMKRLPMLEAHLVHVEHDLRVLGHQLVLLGRPPARPRRK